MIYDDYTLDNEQIVLSTGCDDFIRKPFRATTIFEEMNKHLGMQYIYADDSHTDRVNTYSKLSLTMDSFQGLSTTWLADMRDACINLDDQLLLELIKQLPPEKSDLFKTLKNMIDNFEIDSILNVIAQDEY